MIFFIFILAMIMFYELKVAGGNEFNREYISPGSTTCINGVFVVLVFLSHICQYIKLDGVFDGPYSVLRTNLGQMVVVTFLFYSGYGIMESIKKKGYAYIKDIPFKRFFRLFYHMAIAVMLYVVMNFFLGNAFSLKKTLLAFTGWTSIGNSNWYILAIFVVYIITFISFTVFRKNSYLAVGTVTALSVAYVYLLMRIGKESWYYNTLILYAAGMWYSLMKKHIETLLMKNDVIYYTVGAAIVTVYYYVYLNRGKGIEWYSVWGILFMALVLLLTMKLNIGNRILSFLGSHVFSVYILQRIPMTVLTKIGLNTSHKYAFTVICFFITIALAVLYDHLIGKLDNLIYSGGLKKK
ncbi:MAG: acyltransferase [Ruminococcaceae bacterium]|nr:acyltransferase [Oscillospiraceae bacterium]